MNSPEPTFKKLTDHKFIIDMANDYFVIMKMERKGVNYSDLTPLQMYQYDVGFRAGQILNQLERIEQAAILVNSYPYIKSWRSRFGQFEYFQYHMEAYYLAIAGLTDRLLILINQLCVLGLSDKDARMSPVVRLLKDSPYASLIVLIQNLKQGTQKVKSMRNKVTHAERFHDQDLWHIALLEHAVREKLFNDPDGYIKEDADFFAKIYRDERRKQLQDSNEALTPMVAALLDVFSDVYLGRKETLQKTSEK